jgi:hypothetical protein
MLSFPFHIRRQTAAVCIPSHGPCPSMQTLLRDDAAAYCIDAPDYLPTGSTRALWHSYGPDYVHRETRQKPGNR